MAHIKATATILLTILLAGCSSTSEEKIAKQEQINQLQNERVSEAEKLMSTLQQRLSQAKLDKLDYFAPEQLEQAQDDYQEALEDFDDIAIDKAQASNDKVGDIAEAVQKSNMALDAAYRIKLNTETIMAESFDIRERIKQLNAPTIKQFTKAYRSISEDIDDIVEDIADGDLEDAREDNAELLPKLRALEVSVVKHIELRQARISLAALKKARAERYIPNMHKLALAKLRAAESTIANAPRDQQQIQQAVTSLTFELDHARHVLQAVQEVSKIKQKTAERYITIFENQLHKVNLSAGGKDMRNLSFNEQFAKLNSLVASLKSKVDQLENSAQKEASMVSEQLQLANNKTSALEQLALTSQAQLKQQQQVNSQLQLKVLKLEQSLIDKEQQLLDSKKQQLQPTAASKNSEI